MVYLIPSFLSEGATETIPSYVMDSVKHCRAIFSENMRTARRFLKKMDPGIVIDDFRWFELGKQETQFVADFEKCISENLNIAIISEAGCPGIADPGQVLVEVAQRHEVPVKPLVGPNSILLALMASGMNGQQFSFHGYLPIEADKRAKKIRQLEEESAKNHATQIFIETPYRNDAMLRDLIRLCKPDTALCVAVDITAETEMIRTRSIREWKSITINLHKRPAIFLLLKR